MAQRPRIHSTDTHKALVWDRWQRGESLHEIATLFDRYDSSVRRILAETGGIRPAPRRRAVRALTLAEREEISCSSVAGQSIRAIALQLQRPPLRSVVRSDEVAVGTASATDRSTTSPTLTVPDTFF